MHRLIHVRGEPEGSFGQLCPESQTLRTVISLLHIQLKTIPLSSPL